MSFVPSLCSLWLKQNFSTAIIIFLKVPFLSAAEESAAEETAAEETAAEESAAEEGDLEDILN